MMLAPFLPGISIRLIQWIVADHYQIPPEAMISPARRRDISWPRQMAIALVCEFLPRKSGPTIGHYFGGRDNSTVIHAQHAVIDRAAADPSVRAALAALRAAIEAHRPAEAQLELELAA